MGKISGESLMKIGWGAFTLVSIVFMIFYINDISPESKDSISGLFAMVWAASSLIYGGGMRVRDRLRRRINELESLDS